MTPHPSRLLVGVAALLLALVALPGPTTGANENITLFGNRVDGWGRTNTTLTSPGPDLSVTVGDNVTLTLNSTDQFDHSWYIDYDNDTNPDPSEPRSPDFPDNQGNAITWNFTADRNGTFIYRSRFNQDDATMWGNITIALPGSGPSPSDALPYVLAGGLLAAIVLIAIVTVYLRRRKASGPPPPPPT